ncbi:MAG: YbhN family protein [Actinomycetia bacterium]|nr:YbhN family protein [Actinomycetes bacterium]
MSQDETPELSAPKPKFGKQQIIATVLTLLILVLVFVVILPQFGDYSAAWTAIQNMELWQIGLIVLATVGLILVYVLPYTAALPGLKYKAAFYTRQTSFMISNVVPGGGAWGLAVQYGMLTSYGYGVAPATSTIGITSVWNTFVTLSLPVVALVGLAATGQSNGQAALVTFIAAAVVVAMIVVFALVLRSESFSRKIGVWANGIIHWAAGVIKKDVTVDAEQGILDFRESIVDVVSDRWILITLANVGQQLAQFSILYLAVVALQGGFNGPVSLLEAFAAFAFGRLATFIPIPPGGLGTTDAIITAALTTAGLPNNDALAATMVWRAATYFPQVIIGAITMLLWKRQLDKKAV